MLKADFIHLVRLSELASADDSAAYRRSVAWFAAVGYLWVLGCFVLAMAAVLGGGYSLAYGHLKTVQALLLLMTGGGLLWASVRALWLRWEPPTGHPLTAAQAPALFDALERIRQKIRGPAIDYVLLDARFNASIIQRPRWGVLGGATNYLTIGLPLLLALDRSRFLAVMTHEYGHLRASHGQFAAWIYRTRLSWMKLEQSMRNDSGVIATATHSFLRWYFPRFMAKTFALARQDEYEADRIAGKLLGPDIAGAALTELAIKDRWLHREFWPLHWGLALQSPQPVGPFAAMRVLWSQPLDADFAREALRLSLAELSGLDDTHPVLRDRLEALQAHKQLPPWSTRSAIDLLGAQAGECVAQFDKEWCQDNAIDWKLHHAYLQRVSGRIAALQAAILRNNPDEMTQLGDLQRRLHPKADVRSCYERALQITPGHAGALRGLVEMLPDSEFAGRMEALTQLFESSMAHKWWASHTAVGMLEKSVAAGEPDDKALRVWRERLKQADAAEQRAWEELAATPFFQSIARHDLDDFEAGEFRFGLTRCKPVRRAWLVRKTLKEFAYRRCYLVFVELPGMSDEERFDLCRELERSLDLPGPALVLWAGYSPTLADIEKNAGAHCYARGGSKII